MKIERMELGPLGACCYILINEETKGAVIIDPGGDAPEVIRLIKENGLKPGLLINTHGHGDHIGANKELKEAFPDIKICIHEEDEAMLTHPSKNLSFLGGWLYKSPPANVVLKEGDRIGIEGIELEVIHTPGHTPGGICLLSRSDNNPAVLFSGDSLFRGSIGRTDLPGGSYDALIEALEKKILPLPGNTLVYPGHGPGTTLEEEKGNNPFLKPT